MMEQQIVLKLSHLSKSFGNIPVLRDVNLTLCRGEVLGLVGENGAGKSTMMNVLGGIHERSGGEIELFGKQYHPTCPGDAVAGGIAFIHQELNLFGNLSIAENLFIDQGLAGKAFVSKRRMRVKTEEILERLGIKVDPSATLETLPMGMRQMVEIAKAVTKSAKIIIFDEPTTSLSTAEREVLFGLIREFTASGISMIYISHALEDVMELCDEILVLRDGEIVGGQTPKAEMTKELIINRMIGREMGQVYPYVDKTPGEDILEARGLNRGSLVRDVSLKVRRGEIVGIFGLMGAGRTELARVIFGVDQAESGEIIYDGERLERWNPRAWVDKSVAFITENRKEEGLLLTKSVSDNLAMVNLRSLKGRFGRLDVKRQEAQTSRVKNFLHIKTANASKQAVGELSGGNQQKVVIGKWLLINPRLLIMDEPTRGVDVGAKFEIYTQINRLATEGSGILFISSEMEELMGVCDRILVMRGGRISGEVERDSFTSVNLLKLAIGEDVQ